jgi:hypothetical protein
MESHEPAIVHKDPGRFTQPMTRTITGKRRRKSKNDGAASSSQNSREALPVSAPANATVTGRKRTALDPSCPIRRSPRLSSEHSAPGSGKCAQPELDRQSDQVTGQPPPPSFLGGGGSSFNDGTTQTALDPPGPPRGGAGSHPSPPPSPLAASQRPYRIQLSRAKRNPHGAGPHAIGPPFCSSLANIILPLGRTNLFSSRLMIECPRRNGKQSRHLWIGTSPQHSSLPGLRTMARIH